MVRYCKSERLPFEAWNDALVLVYPLSGEFNATIATSTRLTAMIEIFGIGTVGILASSS